MMLFIAGRTRIHAIEDYVPVIYGPAINNIIFRFKLQWLLVKCRQYE